MKQPYIFRVKGFFLLILAIILALIQLAFFDHKIAQTTQWTDGQAESWTVFSPIADASIIIAILVLIFLGAFWSLSLKNKWLRIALTFSITLLAWTMFYFAQIGIQSHLSGFSGV